MRGTWRHRRAVALLTCLLWLLGVEVLPNVHLATHDDDHTHTPAGMVVTVSFTAHDDDHAWQHERGLDHEHAQPAPERRTRRRIGAPQLAFDVAPRGHSATAHHAVALHAPALPAHDAVFAQRLVWDIAPTPIGRPHDVPLARPHARGPPAG